MARSKQKKVENRDSGEINDAAGKVTEKSATKPLSEQRKSRLKNNVTASRSEEELKYFLKCVRFAMELTCEKSTEKERRSNCIRVVAYVAVVLAKDGKLQLLEALVKFCQESQSNDCFIQLHDVTVVAARTQICFLIGMLFNADLIMNERAFEARDSLPIDQSVIPSDLKNSLYQILLQRRLDSSAAVRVEVLKGVSMIQHDCLTETKGGQSRGPFITPLQVLRKHFRDESSDCQLVAVRTISLAAKPEIDLMVEMALGSASTKVRRAALSRLAKDVDLKALSIAQRMELLKLMMQSRELRITFLASIHCDALNEMLNEWLTGATDRESNLSDDDVIDTSEYCFASTKLLRFLEPFNDEKTSHDLLVVAFRRCRERLLLQNAEVHEFVKKFIENANDTMTHSHSYNNLLNRKLTTLEQANAIFVWRCMVDFCEQETTSDADWIECRYRLLPTLHTFCDFVTKFTTLKSLYDDGEAGAAFKQFALLQLLKLLSCFDMDDPVGKQSLRNLSEMILTNRQLDVSNEIVNTIVRHMYTYVWPNPQDNDDALSTICDLTSSMVHKSINPNATMLLVNETISLSGHLPNADTTIAHADNEVDEETLLRCIRIVSAVLKTNRYRVMTALLRGLLENLIEKGVVSMNSECRILALESMGIIAMYDERIAFEKVILIKDTLEVDDDLKPTSLNILCNMCLLHGYANVSKWFAGSAVDFCDPRNDLIKVFVEFINDKVRKKRSYLQKL
ncbi:unnamed protein product [Anisakis simplex]|uniref:Cnd3 domain-containing protein n=1 Tax=Anisakis simplex TaxID=6269 RepID=A0A0M3KA66_ANISI|nr:unnamed protein product [Anisakis simplex]